MNRTKMIFNSTIISVCVLLVQGILTMIRTRVFIQFYGSETNGVVELSSQIFSYLVLLESGLGAAYLFKMYKPMSDQNHSKVNSLYKGLEISLKKIAITMFIILAVIAVAYPTVINENSLSYFKIVFIILLLGIRFILPYYLTISKKNLLCVYEKKYIVNLIDGILASIILVFEIILCSVFKIDIIITLFIGIIANIAIDFLYRYILKKECNQVITLDEPPSFEGNSMTKDIFVHQVSSVVFSSTDNIILSILSSLNNVTIYSAYNSVLYYPTTLINKLMDNLRATLGRKMIENENEAIDVFYQTISLNYFITVIIAPLFFLFINDFVELWIGKEFVLNVFCVVLWTSLLIHRCIMPAVYIARDAKGLYKESKNFTIFQAAANIIISLALVWKLGITGLLLGTVLSTYLILIPGNYNLVSKKILKTKNNLLLYLLLVILCSAVMIGICSLFNIYVLSSLSVLSWKTFIIKLMCDSVIVIIITSIGMYLVSKSFRKLVKRFFCLVNFKSKIKN